MSRPFAFWITEATEMSLRGPSVCVSGAALGREPEVGQALVVVSPFASGLRTRYRGSVSAPRGPVSVESSILVEPISGFAPSSLEGAVLVEEGVTYHAFAAHISDQVQTPPVPARFDLGPDRAYGLVRARAGILNGLVVGGGLGGRPFWQSVQALEPMGLAPLLRKDIAPVEQDDADVWAMRPVQKYSHASEKEWLVLRSVGPVSLFDVSVLLDGDWREASVVQQESGRECPTNCVTGSVAVG